MRTSWRAVEALASPRADIMAKAARLGALVSPTEMRMSGEDDTVPEVAFYYPGHLWRNPEWMKTLLLFFDGIGLLIPEYRLIEPELRDPILAIPLRDRELLHYLVADKVVDQKATQRLVTAITRIIESGALDSLCHDGSAFESLSRSRMGYYGDRRLAEELFRRLEARGLARKSTDDFTTPLHPSVRCLFLVLLAQILRPEGRSRGYELSPVTDQFEVVRALAEFLDLPASTSAGRVVAFDLQDVAVDLSSVPLDEVLDFRQMHLKQHRRYLRSVRKFARELSLMSEEERSCAFSDRQAELDDLASDLKKTARSAWKRPASFAVGLAGASWTYATGDATGALLAASALLAGGMGQAENEAGAFSYLFAVRERFV